MDKIFNGDINARKKALRGNPFITVSDLWNNFKRNNAITIKPRPGDIVIYKNGSSHTCLIENLMVLILLLLKVIHLQIMILKEMMALFLEKN